MRIIVTGGSGRIGWSVYHNLIKAGHEVLGVDIQLPRSDVRNSLRVDLTKSGEIYGALGQFKTEAVVHMGAWANPGHVPDQDTYRDNTTGTFNLFQACADLGIQRIVSASSAQVYGFRDYAPEYVRVDESHPLHPLNAMPRARLRVRVRRITSATNMICRSRRFDSWGCGFHLRSTTRSVEYRRIRRRASG